MAFDGITMHFVLRELQTCLIGGKINKIYQPSKNELLLGIYASGNHYLCNIHISADCYHINLTTSKKENPIKAPNFCMLLRKYLLGSKITNITSYGLERILVFHLEGYNELNDKVLRHFIIELMGKHSNIILTNEHNRIIDSLRHLDSTAHATRDILPAREYTLPSNTKQDFLVISFQDFYKQISATNTTDIAKALSLSYTGFSYTFIKHLLTYLSITTWNLDTAGQLFETLHAMLEGKTNVHACSLASDYTLLPTKEEVPPLALNFYLDDYYTRQRTARSIYNLSQSSSKISMEYTTKNKSCIGKHRKKITRLHSYGHLSSIWRIINQ